MKKSQNQEQDTENIAGVDMLKFAKKQMIKKYADKADILSVILRDGAVYTDAEVMALLNEFMKGKVKK